MTVTITEFRKNVFDLVERALKGELIEVSHKGKLVRLTPEPEHRKSKLARLVSRGTVIGSFEELEAAQQNLSAEIREGWEKKWHGR
jgi:prevent-host-death family protein